MSLVRSLRRHTSIDSEVKYSLPMDWNHSHQPSEVELIQNRPNVLNGFADWLFGRVTADAKAAFLLTLLCGPFGVFYFLLLLAFHLPGTVTEGEEFRLFMEGWLFVPVLVLLTVGIVYRVWRSFLPNQALYPVALLWVASISILIFVAVIHWLGTAEYVVFVYGAGLALFPMTLALVTYAMARNPSLERRLPPATEAIMLACLPLFAAGILLYFIKAPPGYPAYAVSVWTLIPALALGLLVFFRFPNQKQLASHQKKLVDGLALILIGLACFDPQLTMSLVHENFYLGPVNAILQGRTILVDALSQYGVFNLLFFATIFRTGILPFNYQAFALLNAIFYTGQFALLYWLALKLVKSRLYAFILLLALLLLNLFATWRIAQMFPSIGPMRFGIPYLLLALVTLRDSGPQVRRQVMWLEYALVGLASIWSFETFAYTLLMYLGIVGFEVFAKASGSSWVRSLALRLVAMLAAIVIFHLAFAAMIFQRSRSWPRWDYYLSMILKYSAQELGALPIAGWSLWALLITIYFIALMAVLLRLLLGRNGAISLEEKWVGGLACLGVAQFTYFLGRSHPNALYHICVPAVLIFGYWIFRTQPPAGKEWVGFQYGMRYLATVMTLLVFITFGPVFGEKFENTGFSLIGKSLVAIGQEGGVRRVLAETSQRLYHPPAYDPLTLEVEKLITVHWKNERSVAVFVGTDIETEALIRSGKVNLLPISHALQDELSARYAETVLMSAERLRSGDKILLLANPGDSLVLLQSNVLKVLCERFSFREIHRSSSGFSVVRLKSTTGPPDPYCSQLLPPRPYIK